MGDVTDFTGAVYGKIPVNQVLEAAKSAGLAEVVIMGVNNKDQIYYASSEGKHHAVRGLVELIRDELINTHVDCTWDDVED